MKRVIRAVQQHSMEVFLAILCLITGLPILLNPAMFAPTSILALFSLPLVFAWGLTLVVGGLLNLIGIATGNAYVRRAGLLMLAAGSLVMGLGVVALTGASRLFAAGTFFIFSWATAARYWELGKGLRIKRRRWERKLREK